MKKIVIITDAWTSAGTNGVVTVLLNIRKHLQEQDFEVVIIHPGQFFTVRLPMDASIKMVVFAKHKLAEMLQREQPGHIHIATEGPLGLTARRLCVQRKWKFTTFYHTRFPEYIEARLGGWKNLTYRYLRWFHSASTCTMVSTASLKRELESQRFVRVAITPLGIDLKLFHRNLEVKPLTELRPPIFVFLGRVAPEKNIEAFLKCGLSGSKLIIGDGISRSGLEKKYHGQAQFVGLKKGTELVNLLSASDVLVFPSRTDTFGLVILEAMACGLPVAAYNVPGPADIITDGVDGFLGDDLAASAKKCLKLDRQKCVEKAARYSWENSAREFIKNLDFDLSLNNGHRGPA